MLNGFKDPPLEFIFFQMRVIAGFIDALQRGAELAGDFFEFARILGQAAKRVFDEGPERQFLLQAERFLKSARIFSTVPQSRARGMILGLPAAAAE